MENFIIIGIVALIIVLAAVYIIRAKRRGRGCIGCPYSGNCENKGTPSSCSKGENK